MTHRIYIIASKAKGKKKVYVNAATRTQAQRVVMEQFFTTTIATHAELFEAFKGEDTEIIDATVEPQVDIEEKIEDKKAKEQAT